MSTDLHVYLPKCAREHSQALHIFQCRILAESGWTPYSAPITSAEQDNESECEEHQITTYTSSHTLPCPKYGIT